MNIYSLTIWQPEDGHSLEIDQPNLCSIELLDGVAIMKTERYAFTKEELFEIIELLEHEENC
jgi:hypothetical protein